jgi:PHD/YefM family antitoxin component YafN of YafNO toxin-antitoxin module
MQVTATEAKNRFGYVCAQAKQSPVFVEKDGRVDSVILSVEQFRALQAAKEPKSMAQRKKEFQETYKDWIDAQHALIERVGIPGEDLRPW